MMVKRGQLLMTLIRRQPSHTIGILFVIILQQANGLELSETRLIGVGIVVSDDTVNWTKLYTEGTCPNQPVSFYDFGHSTKLFIWR